MEKLMDTDPYNRAIPKKLIGDDMFGDTYPTCSTTCQKQTDCDDCPIQEAFERLRKYEKTGLTPGEIMELKVRDTVKNPVHSQFKSEMVCPACGSTAYPWYTFCDECGQRLWDDEKP